MTKKWVPFVVIAACLVGATAIAVWYGSDLCEREPAFCEPMPDEHPPSLIPLFGLVGGVAVILGLVGLIRHAARGVGRAPQPHRESTPLGTPRNGTLPRGNRGGRRARGIKGADE